MHINNKAPQKQQMNLSLKHILSISICLFLFNVAVNAQKIRPGYEGNPTGAMVPPPVAGNSVKPANDDIKQKIQDIENSNATPEEKSTMIAAILAIDGVSPDIMSDYTPYTEITFQPKYFPVAIMDSWLNIAKSKKQNALKNIVIVNEAYALDFNNYFDKNIDAQFNKLIEDNPLTEEMAFKYVLPDLKFINNLNAASKPGSLVSMLKLYFANQPGLYTLLPKELTRSIQTEQGMNGIRKNMESKK